MENLTFLYRCSYIELNILSLLMLGFMNLIGSHYLKGNGHEIQKRVSLITCGYILFLVSDTAWFILDSCDIRIRPLLYLPNMFYFLSIFMVSNIWLIYTLERLGLNRPMSKRSRTIISAPFAILGIFIFTAPLDHLFFYINDKFEYIRGPLYIVYAILISSHYIISGLVSFIVCFTKKKKKRMLAAILGIASFSLVISFNIQAVTGINLSCFCCLFTIVLFLAYEIFTDQHYLKDKIKRYGDIMPMLTMQFASIHHVNLNDDSFSTVEQDEYSSKNYKEIFNCGSYKKAIETLVNNAVLETDRPIVSEALAQKNIKEMLSNRSHFTVPFRSMRDGEVFYCELIIYKEDKFQDDGKLVLGFMNRNDFMHKELAVKELEALVDSRTNLLREKNKILARTNMEIVELMGDMVESRDTESGTHIKRVKTYTRILSNCVRSMLPEYNLSKRDVNNIIAASVLHDVGKIMISDNILLKPGKLTDDEFQIMKLHTIYGCEILKKAPPSLDKDFLKTCMEICRWHHEKYDGKGYPDGLVGDQIPISAQIVSIADCFDALTTKRVYKPPFGPDKAFQMILDGECGAFSEKLLECFTLCYDEFTNCVKEDGSPSST
ncbi:MAG: HD domain-containing protein [Lachnospiraceae bacterium]|nr:HD domain-containing protein [Lachnospiraceae bacterium]